MEYTRAQILENRQKWIAFLKEPNRKKGVNTLQSETDPEARCCLGHGAHVLDPNHEKWKVGQSYLPNVLVVELGLHNPAGGTKDSSYIMNTTCTCLARVNDDTIITPKAIGEYLESVINGGHSTPFKLLSYYPE